MEIFTEINGHNLALIISIGILMIVILKNLRNISLYTPLIAYPVFLLIIIIDIIGNGYILGLIFKHISQSIYFVNNFSPISILYLLMEAFVLVVFGIVYFILLSCLIKFVEEILNVREA